MGMFGGFGQIIGGAMQGYGSALEKQAEDERAAAIKWAQSQHEEQLREQGMGVSHGYQTQENDQQHGYRMAEGKERDDRADTREATSHSYRLQESDHSAANARSLEGMRESHDDSQVSGYQTTDENEVVGFDRKGNPVKTGVKLGGLSKKDKDLIGTLEPQFSSKVQTQDEDGNKTTTLKLDSASMAQRLNDMGRPDLAKMYGGGQGKPAPAPGTGGPTKLPKDMTPDAARAQARLAIQNGKDPQAVKARLQAMGVDPTGL